MTDLEKVRRCAMPDHDVDDREDWLPWDCDNQLDDVPTYDPMEDADDDEIPSTGWWE
jgi:hypothetical protein